MASSSQSYGGLEDLGDIDEAAWSTIEKEIEQAMPCSNDLTLLQSFDARAGRIIWNNGYKTILPWGESNIRSDVSLSFF